ncbi:MAG: hypothetical protein M3075_11300 [Candidatus Dormibacteraeota bacterium]|nr:hypothetical protein [Candidatus Dormibacteraeota bacterium]
MSLHVFSAPSVSGTRASAKVPLATLQPVGVIAPPSKLELSGGDGGVLIELILEEVCVCCRGDGFVPVTVTETCSNCGASGYELIEDDKQACGVCDGSCWVPVDEMEQCERCDGTGLELTAVGRRLMRRSAPQLWAFLNRWREWRGEV